MGLSGSQTAYKLAVADVARADATRSAYFLRNVVPVWINGAARTGVVQQSIRIDLNTGEEPHRCSFEFKGGSGFVPQAGHEVTIGHGTTDNALFAGRVLRVERVAARNDDKRPTYRCDAAGWLFDLKQSRVMPGFSVQSLAPRSLVAHLLTVTSPNVRSMGFAATYIDPALPVVEEFSIGPTDDLGDALARVFRGVDALWYVGHDRQIRAFGAVNSLPAVPSTLTSASSQVWNVRYVPTDMARAFTRVHVVGAGQPTVADFEPSRHRTVPLASASLLGNAQGSFGEDAFINTTESWLFDGVQFSPGFFYTPKSQFNAGQASVFLPASRATNTLVVVAANVASAAPIDAQRWYDISGQWLYVSSNIGVYSATASSIAYAYWLHSDGSGAITSDIQGFADIASGWNLTINSPTLYYRRMVPAGTAVQVFTTKVNSAGVDYLTSATGSAQFGLVSRTVSDGRLAPDGAAAVASAALQRGDPSNWAQLEFETRERAYDIGGPVFVAMTSPAEPSGDSVQGTFTAQDVTLGEFGRLTETKGPVRTVIAGAVRRPTLWQVLQGD